MNRLSYSVTLVVGSVVVSGLAIAFASARQRMRAGEVPSQVRKTAEVVDGVLQDRFRRRLEVFGVSRIALPKDGNMIHARSTTTSDVARLKEADALGCDYRVFFHATRDLRADKLKGPLRYFVGSAEPMASRDYDLSWANREKDFVQAVGKNVTASDTALKTGLPVDKQVGAWWLMARPVKAEASCVSCHTAAKTGETLGVLVYTIQQMPQVRDAQQAK